MFSEEDETVHSETISVSGAINFVEINFPGVLRPDNASFEDNDGAAPAEWTSNREFGSAIISVSDDYASDGDYSLKIDGSEVNGSAWFRSAMLPVSPGDHLTGRIDVYVEKSTSGNDSNHPILYFEFRNASGTRLEEGGLVGEAISDTEGEWERVVVEGVVPQGVSYVTLWVYTGTSYDGLTYWDNATVEYATAL